MNTMYGTASVYNVDGDIQINGATAIAAFPDSIEEEQRAQIEEFMDGYNELIGLRKSDEREYCDVTIIAKKPAGAGSIDSAIAAMKFPPVPARISLTLRPESTAFDLNGNPATAANIDYIYTGGARRTRVRGQAALRLTCFKPKSSPLTVPQLLTVCT
jgi:hypothetical protein